MKNMRDKVTGARRWVVKIGSALLTADGKGLDRAAMDVWVKQMVALRQSGAELVLVSSGAVAAGMNRVPKSCMSCRPPPPSVR
jgi:glutamate 5-kinase